jgi:hypothetical protein
VANRGWKRPFDEPIPLPRGRQLVTLKDAADYIMKLPRVEQNLKEWQTAVRCLIGAAEGRDFMMHARHRHVAGVKSERRAWVQFWSQRSALGQAEAEERFVMITPGKYTVWFRTPVGEGAGVVDFGSNGELCGGDTTFAYTGRWEQDRERFKATISAKRVEPGPPGVFGMDEIDIIVAGYSDDDGVSASCTGFAKQSPGLKLEVTLHRMRDD